jgi:hypothetical protein
MARLLAHVSKTAVEGKHSRLGKVICRPRVLQEIALPKPGDLLQDDAPAHDPIQILRDEDRALPPRQAGLRSGKAAQALTVQGRQAGDSPAPERIPAQVDGLPRKRVQPITRAKVAPLKILPPRCHDLTGKTRGDVSLWCPSLIFRQRDKLPKT